MKPARYGREILTADNDLTKTDETLSVVKNMEKALGENADNMADYFHDDFRWMGNRGCGTKEDLKAFRENWQLPIRAAFTDRQYYSQVWITQGEWASCFGHIEGTHSGTFMGIEATGKRVTIPYTDFWHVKDGKIADNWVSVDFAHVLHQLGRDVFDGNGWEAFDEGRLVPPKP
ncbi:MAG: ester cyclase [Ahrensia sp.]|nr:ester cyclase [Ahrensia sp.]